MDWRRTMLEFCGPGWLAGISLRKWLQLLSENRGQIDAAFLPRAAMITLQSLKTSLVGAIENRRFKSLIERTVIRPPLFILGHWRSGTTHLHQLIAQDDRLAYPNSYQTSFPNVFLTLERMEAPMLSLFLPKHRPMDQVELSLSAPQEDEFALCASTLLSPCMGLVFPRQSARFLRYLSFRDASPAEVTEWKKNLLNFLKKVQSRSDRPLVLKSPPHTARIKLLLELFPEAKFVHIHRDPFRVFQSTRRTFLALFRWNSLQHPKVEDLDEWILNQYAEMYSAFFEERNLIPKGHYHEVRYENLEKEPIVELRSLYHALGLPEFDVVEPKLKQYVEALTGYRKNTFSDLPPELRQRIYRRWKSSFEEWGYPASENTESSMSVG